LKGGKTYIGCSVETPNGTVGNILNYDKRTGTFNVELGLGRIERFKPIDLKLILSVDSDSNTVDSSEPSPPGKGAGPCSRGGTDDW
jgi:hypothetical protein